MVSTRDRPPSPRSRDCEVAATRASPCPMRSSTRRSATSRNAPLRTAPGACSTILMAAVGARPSAPPQSPASITRASTTATTFPPSWILPEESVEHLQPGLRPLALRPLLFRPGRVSRGRQGVGRLSRPDLCPHHRRGRPGRFLGPGLYRPSLHHLDQPDDPPIGRCGVAHLPTLARTPRGTANERIDSCQKRLPWAVERLGTARRKIMEQLSRVIVGQHQVVDELLISLFSRGHCLLEGVPGLAKTLMISTLAQNAQPVFQPHPVHSRPDARRHHRHRRHRGEPFHRISRLPVPGGPAVFQRRVGRRDQPDAPEGRRRRSWKPCRNAR